MAPNFYLKPETALSKAKEFIKVGKKLNALEILYDMMRSRRSRVWQKNLQDLMLLFVDLCVELKKNTHFRKVIHQYKNVTVQECPQSLEVVLKHYLNSIKTLTEEARQKSKDAVCEIDDLDSLETPESLMLNAVSTEGVQDRSDRAILMPWLRFLWDSYRIVLDLLRSVSKFERLYHDIAHDAYDFCIRYSRRTEFKKLSEILRTHTSRNQMQSNVNSVNMNNQETQTLHLQTRLRQLDCAMDLEMYNDAFRAVEDIWSFVSMSKKASRPLLMADYYARTADLFLRSGCHLFHAAALLKLMNLHREAKKTVTKEELSQLGSQVLCAILAIPLPHERMHFDKFLISGESSAVKLKALSNLLGLPTVPTRQSLIRDLTNTRIYGHLPQELTQLYAVLETEFQPLKLYQLAKPSLDYVAGQPDLAVYMDQLNEVCAAKTVLQVAQIYKSIKFDELCKLCPFDPLRFERILVDLIHNLELPIRIDHRNQAIYFDVFTDMGISQRKYGPLVGLPGVGQNGSTDQLSRQLTIFADVVQNINDMIIASDKSSEPPTDRTVLINDYLKSMNKHRKQLLDRPQQIESRKEKLEQVQEEREKYVTEMEVKRKEQLQREQEEEEKRLQDEAREREHRRAEEEATRLKRKINQDRIRLMVKADVVSDANKDAWKDLTEEQIDKFDADEIIEKKMQELAKKRRELMEKAKNKAKSLDYLTRAMRIEELPLLREQALIDAQKRKEFAERSKLEMMDKSKFEHAQMLKDRDRLKRLSGQVKTAMQQLKELADRKLKEDLAQWEQLCEEEREKRKKAKLEELEAERQREEKRRAEDQKREDERAAVQVTRGGGRHGDNDDYVIVNKSDVEERKLYRPPAVSVSWQRSTNVLPSSANTPDNTASPPKTAPSTGTYVPPNLRSEGPPRTIGAGEYGGGSGGFVRKDPRERNTIGAGPTMGRGRDNNENRGSWFRGTKNPAPATAGEWKEAGKR